MNLTQVFAIKSILLVLIFITGCVKSPEVESTSSDSRYLYVSTGVCYSGNNTTFSNTTSSNLVYRVSTETAQVDSVIADYFSSPANTGDSPSSIVNNDSESFFVLVENSSTTSLRRIERVEKKANGLRTTFSGNVAAMNNRLRDIYKLPNGDIAVSKSIGIEYFTAVNARIGAPFINPTAAPCNTSTTLISKVLPLSNGKYVFLHAAAGQNRFGIFASTGGTTCAAAQAAPTANAYPSAAFYDAANAKLIVAYSGNSVNTDINSIYAYSINETTNAITSAQKLYDASLYPTTYEHLLYGVSDMTYDAATGTVYIATAISTATTVVNYVIEKFTYDPTQIGVDNTQVLTRVGTTPFFNFGSDTKCISKMFVAD